MAKQAINIGSSANDGQGSTLRAGGDLINDNFNEIYNLIGNGTDLSLASLTLTTPTIAEIDSGSTITLDATTDIVLDAGGGDIFFKDDTALIATFTNSSTDFLIESATSDKDIIFKVNDGGSSTEVMRLDGDVSALLFPTNKEIRFTDANESVKGDGSNLILKSGGTAFTIPASDGSSGQFLKTDGSGALSFDTVSSAADDLTTGDAAITLATSAGNITIDAQGNDTDIIFKGTDGGSDITPMTLDMSDAGALFLTGGKIDLKNAGTRSKILFYCESGNAHAQTLQAAPHSESASNTLTLPSTGGDVDLVSTASTATLTNKTLTSPKINEDVAVTSTATELNIMDGDTSASSTTLVDADRLVTNDAGTMKQVALSDVKTYLSSAGFSTDDPTALAIALG